MECCTAGAARDGFLRLLIVGSSFPLSPGKIHENSAPSRCYDPVSHLSTLALTRKRSNSSGMDALILGSYLVEEVVTARDLARNHVLALPG
jgi:hypothetical protein